MEAEATEEESVEATVETETVIEMVSNETKTVGKGQGIKSRALLKPMIRPKKRTNSRMTTRLRRINPPALAEANSTARRLAMPEAVNERVEAEASVEEETTNRSTATRATDNMMRRKSTIKKSKTRNRINLKRAVK